MENTSVANRLVALCALVGVSDFDPTQEIDADAEQFLRVNIEAHKDRLPQYVAHVMIECYKLGKK